MLVNLTPEYQTPKKHLFFGHFCRVFRWSDPMIRQTIQELDIFDQKIDILSPVFRPPYKNQTIRQPDTFGPFEYQSYPVFRWLE